MQHIKNLAKTKNPGFVDACLMFIIALIILSTFFVYLIAYIQPIKKYIDLNQLARKYSLLMEKEGYLSPSNKDKLLKDLNDNGFNLADINIDDTTQTKVNFGDEVKIKIVYNFRKIDKTIDGLNITNKEVIIPMEVDKSTTSKNGG